MWSSYYLFYLIRIRSGVGDIKRDGYMSYFRRTEKYCFCRRNPCSTCSLGIFLHRSHPFRLVFFCFERFQPAIFGVLCPFKHCRTSDHSVLERLDLCRCKVSDCTCLQLCLVDWVRYFLLQVGYTMRWVSWWIVIGEPTNLTTFGFVFVGFGGPILKQISPVLLHVGFCFS